MCFYIAGETSIFKTLHDPVRQAIAWTRKSLSQQAFAARLPASAAVAVLDTGDPTASVVEADVVGSFLPFRELGCCRVVEHPVWGARAMVTESARSQSLFL